MVEEKLELATGSVPSLPCFLQILAVFESNPRKHVLRTGTVTQSSQEQYFFPFRKNIFTLFNPPETCTLQTVKFINRNSSAIFTGYKAFRSATDLFLKRPDVS